eukprot:symbB.v1.2.036815.t2/scaffold5285.1/size28895/2
MVRIYGSNLEACQLLREDPCLAWSPEALVEPCMFHLSHRPVADPTAMKVTTSNGRRIRGVKQIEFHNSKASAVMGDLSAEETMAVATWFMAKTGAAPFRASPSIEKWLAGPSAVELLRPPKKEVLAYLDGKGPKPGRFARVTMVTKDAVLEYKVGPLVSGSVSSDAKIEILVPAGSIPYAKRPGTEDFFIMFPLVNAVVEEMKPALVEAFGDLHWPSLEDLVSGAPPTTMTANWMPRNDAMAPAGTRRVRVKAGAMPPPPSRLDARWLYPLPFDFEINMTSWNVSEWTVHNIELCRSDPFPSVAALMAAYKQGNLKMCRVTPHPGTWDTPQRESAKSTKPRKESQVNGVSWGPWSFSLTQRPSTGFALTDIKFRGERIAYELALMDTQAIYGGSVRDQFMYSDSAFTQSQYSTSLEPGVDCPEDATFFSAANWLGPNLTGFGDPSKTHTFYPVCVFHWEEDHTIWRHMDQAELRGLIRNTVLVRSGFSVGNYDYVVDVKFRQDGEINVFARFAGYPETRYPGVNETSFSTMVRPGVAGMVHTHSIAFKVDLDISGSQNALHVTEVKEVGPTGLGVNGIPDAGEQAFPTKILEEHYVEREGVGVSTFHADPRVPKAWSIVNRKTSASAEGSYLNPRGYRIELLSFATGQVHSASHPFVQSMPWTKYHLAVTKYQDHEYRPASVYVNFDGQQPWNDSYSQNLDVFLSNNESLMDEDLVAWIGLNKEHIVRQEDIPLVSNFGVAFSLQPWNFFAAGTVEEKLLLSLLQLCLHGWRRVVDVDRATERAEALRESLGQQRKECEETENKEDRQSLKTKLLRPWLCGSFARHPDRKADRTTFCTPSRAIQRLPVQHAL